MTEQTPHIFAALADVMADVDHVAKRDTNTQQNYRFRGVDAVVNAVGPVLRKHRVLSLPRLDHVEYQPITSKSGGLMTSCRVVVSYRFVSSVDGSELTATVAAEAFDYGDKSTPKAMSVAFRTALLQALALPTDDPEPDAETYQQGAPAAQQPPPEQPGAQTMRRSSGGNQAASNAQLGTIAGLCSKLGVTDRDQRLSFIGGKLNPPRTIGSGSELTKREASQLIDVLKVDVAALDEMAAETADEPPAEEGGES